MLSNTRFCLAVHVLCDLAYRDHVVDSTTLARNVGTSAPFLRTLIGTLRDAGLVETRRGRGGGTLLARPAARITLHDVYRATEEPGALIPHAIPRRRRDPVVRAMPGLLADLDSRLVDAMSSELARTTVAELVADHVADG